jgi:precorrin-2 dehydrogenase/sirohydrochlorin ferrochelatase
MKNSRKKCSRKGIWLLLADDLEVNKRIFELCRDRYLICNIADTPELCDYYLGGIVTKNVKIAISTKSPTTAKRLREFLKK